MQHGDPKLKRQSYYS